MITIVYVLLAYTHGSNWVPTLEFSSEKKCIAATLAIKSAMDEKLFMGGVQKPFCVRIEK